MLKCDIRKFFANIDHRVLLSILAQYIPDADILRLLKNIVGSFSSETSTVCPFARNPSVRRLAALFTKERIRGIGLPLGNLTSQLLVNIYMNEFDQFVKHRLKVKYYIRYADDFVLVSEDKTELEQLLPLIQEFLFERLTLSLHPNKVFIKTFASGIDFLGWVHFPYYRVLRTSTRRRMLQRLQAKSNKKTIVSYLGLLSHGNGFRLQKRVRESYS